MLTLLLVAHAATWSSTYPEPVEVPPFDDAGGLSQPPAPHWSVQLPGGVIKAASHTELVRPVILETSILVGSSSGAALYMLDRRNGVLIRSFPAHASVESAPAVVEDRVLFADTGGTVWCYQLDGELLWSFETKAPVLAAPAVADGRVFVSNVDDLVVALSLADGALIWRYQERPDLTRAGELGLYAAPQPVLARGELLVGFSDGALVSLDPADGDVAWLLRVGEGKYPDIVASPASDGDDLVFVSGYFEPTVALDLDSRKVRWTAEFGAAASARVVQDGERRLMVHPGTDGKLRAFDTVTGDPAWTWDSLTDGSLTAPEPTDLGLLVGSTAGTLTLLDPHDGSERWHYEPLRILDGVSSAPAVRGRQIVFVTNAGRLYSMVAPRPERVWAGVSSWDI
ncbi:MAG TPA: PQQ-binding-like beta-propeller repeat protein, partial [Myxococcota bacterium]|nr:PQQ-binding-like beta-propeller repeat protein [Myxococcota bacterium]